MMQPIKQSRFTSWVFWASIAAQVLTILVLVGIITPTQSDTMNGVATALLQAFVAFGILNNPTDAEHF
jgi:hypothetical protein